MLLKKKNKNLFFYLNCYMIIISKINFKILSKQFNEYLHFFLFFKKINHFYLLKKNKFYSPTLNNIFVNYLDADKFNLLNNNVKKINNFSKIKNFIFLNKTLKHKFFNLFFLFNTSLSTNLFNKLNFHNFFYISSKNSNLVLFNVNKILLKWQNTNDLLINIFYYNTLPLIFSTLQFKAETLTLNWIYHKWDYILWKYYYNFFYFKFNKNTDYTDFFFNKLNELRVDFLIITDTNYHYKNLFFLFILLNADLWFFCTNKIKFYLNFFFISNKLTFYPFFGGYFFNIYNF